MKKAWVLSYPLSAQRRLRSDWADAGRTVVLLDLSWGGSNTFLPVPALWATAWQNQQNDAWKSIGFLASHWAHNEDWSDWADTQADLSLHWVHVILLILSTAAQWAGTGRNVATVILPDGTAYHGTLYICTVTKWHHWYFILLRKLLHTRRDFLGTFKCIPRNHWATMCLFPWEIANQIQCYNWWVKALP